MRRLLTLTCVPLLASLALTAQAGGGGEGLPSEAPQIKDTASVDAKPEAKVDAKPEAKVDAKPEVVARQDQPESQDFDRGGAVIRRPSFRDGFSTTIDGLYRLKGEEQGGGQVRILLRVAPSETGAYAVARGVQNAEGLRRVFRGVGELQGPRLVVTFNLGEGGMSGSLSQAIDEDKPREEAYAVYQFMGHQVAGVFHGPALTTDELVWTEEFGHLYRTTEGQLASELSPPAENLVSQDPEPIASLEDTPPMSVEPSQAAGRLAEILAAAVRSAQEELESDVRESPRGSNRSSRIDTYAKTAGMSVGGAWCGYFTSFNYTQAARALTLKFVGQKKLHSVGKCRSFFLYRSFTQRKTAENVARWEAEREAHTAEGAPRRFMTLKGSSGDQRAGNLPHEVYTSYHDLPVEPGDTVLWEKSRAGYGHIGLVASYDPSSGILTTIEGNTSHRVRQRTYDLSDAVERGKIDGFGRPALSDFPPAD